ncbi:hypothetical protein L1887_39773 [Cichorium endivia]|nr:hypothetical protein L1887_39773 [Cichorium endivia]
MGSDICTRHPLRLPLLHTDEDADEFDELWHLPGKKFFNFSQIRAEIQVEIERQVGLWEGSDVVCTTQGVYVDSIKVYVKRSVLLLDPIQLSKNIWFLQVVYAKVIRDKQSAQSEGYGSIEFVNRVAAERHL